MLTGKLVRVRHARNKLVPQYLDPTDRKWLTLADQLLRLFRDSIQRTRGELTEALADLVGEGPTQVVPQGLAKLLEDRCELEVVADVPPDSVREVVFQLAALQHARPEPFDRDAVLRQAAERLNLPCEQVEQALFADLKDEQRVLSFKDLTPEQLLHRYNVALAQAILLRSTRVELRVWSESPARFRQLFRAMKFHRLICHIQQTDEHGYRLTFDGPLSLFSATNKYGLQLAQFLPSVLHCRAFDLRAEVRWGADRKAKTFTLTASDGLKSHLPDFGVFTPPEFKIFAENFRTTVADWILSEDPHPIALDGTIWVPDFKLVHSPSGREVFLELLGFWRKVNLDEHYRRLRQKLPGQFVLAVGESYRTDEKEEFVGDMGIYRFKKTPIAADVAKAAAAQLGC